MLSQIFWPRSRRGPAWYAVWLAASLYLAAPGVRADTGVFYAFSGDQDGAFPHAGLVAAGDGSFYGVATSGGSAVGQAGAGTVFHVTTSGALTTLYTFPTDGAKGSGPNGLVPGGDGNWYGATAGGGSAGNGTIYKLTPAGVFTSLYSFQGSSDGRAPNGLLAASDGNFYGTTSAGGGSGFGTLFKVTTSGTLTTLYTFTGGNDGASPQAALIQATDGNLYGTTAYGGSASGYNGLGTLFVATTGGGSVTTLHAFTGTADGAYPMGSLLQSTAGDLYGTTSAGTSAGAKGTVFKLTTGGAFTTLHVFSGSDGDGPLGGLAQAADGGLYGTTHAGGTNADGTVADGTVYQITSDGAFATQATFSGAISGAVFTPAATLAAGSDGNLYGVAVNGGAGGSGALFTQTITAADAGEPGTLQFSAATYTVSETDGAATITVARTGGGSGTVQVAYAATADSAAAGTDFTPVSGTLSWASGDTASKTFVVSVLSNVSSTANHTARLTLSDATGGATLGADATASLIILDAAAAALPAVDVTVQGDGYAVAGGEKGKLVFTRSTTDLTQALTIHFKVKGTASNGSDYGDNDGVALGNAVVIPAGETKVKIKVKALTIPVSRLTVKVVLEADPNGLYRLGTAQKAKLTIVDPAEIQF